MFLLSAWKPATFNPNDPSQRVRTLYLPNAGQYESVVWDRIPTGDASVLNGILPENRFAQVGIVAGLAALAYFSVRRLRSKGLMGAGRRRRR